MEIHKPKAAHSWREFITEIGTIVCGILIAIGLEQAVEWRHTRMEANEIKHSLDEAISTDMVHVMERLAVHPCLEQRLIVLRETLASAGGTWTANPQNYADASGVPLGVVPMAFRPPTRVMTLSNWQQAVGSRGFLSLPDHERAAYAEIFDFLTSFDQNLLREHELATGLTALSFDGRLTPELRASYLDRLGALSDSELTIANKSKDLKAMAHSLGVSPDAARVDGMIAQQRKFRGGCVANVKF